MILERLREVSQGAVAKILLALISVPFALFGIDYYFKSGPGDALANVSGQAISQQFFQQQLRSKLQELKDSLGANGPDIKDLNTPQYREAVLDQLVNTALVESAARKAGLVVPDKMVIEKINSLDAFKEDGKFSEARYQGLLKTQGSSPAQFEKDLRHDLALTAYQEGLLTSEVVPKVAQEAWVKLANQEREVSQEILSVDAFVKDAVVDEAKVRQWYDSHVANYQTPERVSFQYVLLSAAALGKDIPISPDEIRQAFEARRAKATGQEERRASHILVAVKSSAPDSEKKAARAKAESLLKEVRAHPNQFASLAAKFSEDPGSAKQGGDLGFFAPGAMVKPFEEAAFRMKEGEISGIVQSDFGYHIIRLTGVRGARGETLTEATPAITEELRNQKAQKLFAEAGDTFSNLVFEQSGSLKPVADALKLQIRDGGTVLREGQGLPKELQNVKFLQALFANDVLKDKRNTAAIDLGNGTLVAARATAYEAPAARPFNEVSAAIQETLKKDAALELAKKVGEAALADLNAGKTPSIKLSFEKTALVSRPGANQFLARELVDPVFKLSPDKLPAYAGAVLPGKGYAIVRLSKVDTSKAADSAMRSQAEGVLRQTLGKEDFIAVVGSLRKSANISVNRQMLNALGARPD